MPDRITFTESGDDDSTISIFLPDRLLEDAPSDSPGIGAHQNAGCLPAPAPDDAGSALDIVRISTHDDEVRKAWEVMGILGHNTPPEAIDTILNSLCPENAFLTITFVKKGQLHHHWSE